MLDFARTTDALPMVVQPAPQTEDAIPEYAPSLLLDVAGLDQRIVSHPDFASGCESGFCWYFELMCYDADMKWIGFTFQYLSLDDVLDSIHTGLLQFYHSASQGDDRSFEDAVGVFFGWLSAFSLYQPKEASTGLAVLLSLVRSSLLTYSARLECA